MSSVAYTNAFLQVNSTNLSAFVRSLAINYGSEMLDDTNMGDTTKVNLGGLKTWSFDITFSQDFVAGGPDATLFSLVGTTACWEIRPVNVCSTASNPSYSGIGIISKYPPLGGAVGSHLEATVTVDSASTLSRASSS
jgi:hypothetical protein